MGSTFDVGLEAGAARARQQAEIDEQQRVQGQNTVGAQLLDAINQSSNIKPTMKDDQGNVVANPAYDQAQKDRRDLLQQYVTMNSPEQHATFGQRLHGLIFGHPTTQEREPALNPASAATPTAPAPTPPTPPVAPQHPMAPPNEQTHAALSKGQELLNGLKNHLSAFANPLPAQEQPNPALIAQYYKDPAQVAFERNLQLWGERGTTAEQVAEIRSRYATMNTPEKMFLDSHSKALGFDNFLTTPPDVQQQLLQQYKGATTLPSWHAQQDGNDIYAIDAHDPSKRQLIGHKNDLTKHLVYKTMTQPDGSQYQVPFVEWTKTGSDQPPIQTQASPDDVKELVGPVSANTPKSPSSTAPLATVNSNIASGNAASKKLNKGKPSSSSAPLPPGIPKGAIPFGAKESPIAKVDQATLTKAQQDAQQKQAALLNAQGLLNDPNRATDLSLVYEWVRANVQGAGRMTNTEIEQADKAGSFGTRVHNWFAKAASGRFAPEMEQQFLSDIRRANDTSQTQVNTLKGQLNEDLGKGPVSSAAPKIPSGPSKGNVSIERAMALPENKGKSRDAVMADIRAKGYNPQ